MTILYKQIQKMKDDSEIKITKLDDYIDTSTQLGYDLEKYKKLKELESYIDSSCSQIFCNNTDNKTVLFNKSIVGKIIIGEFMDIRDKYRIELINNNIYQWRIYFSDFKQPLLRESLNIINSQYNYKSIIVDIHIHDILYPNYPPVVKVIRPRLQNLLMHKISNTKMIQLDYWTPTRSLLFVVNKLHNLLDKHAIITLDTDLNDPEKYLNGSYLKIETLLLDLASTVSISDNEDIDDEIYENYAKLKDTNSKLIKPKKDGTVAWTSGTGYGHTGTKKWNIEAYLQSVAERDKLTESILIKILHEIQDTNNDINIINNAIQNSVLITYIKSQLDNTTFLEINKHRELYSKIFCIIASLINENMISVFYEKESKKSLYTILRELDIMCKTAIKYDKSEDSIIEMIVTLVNMIEPYYIQYVSNLEIQNIQNDIFVSEEQEYINKMIELRDKDEYDIIGTNFHYQNDFNNDKSRVLTKNVIKRLRDEFVAFNSLPMSYSAIIISRPDRNYMTAIRTLISGPDNTPYDCGLFIFDTYINKNYPEGPPSVWFLNTGNVRFNPNLYNSGKVCLSILGTWSGDKSETWNINNSTLIQIYISIQAQILIDKPYYNEPGYEQQSSVLKSTEYNNNIRLYTMKYAMLDLLQKPETYSQFTDIIIAHFKMKKNRVMQICKQWVDSAPHNLRLQYENTFASIQTELNKL
jgi:baculoviral IAP repeat-containing protein 6